MNYLARNFFRGLVIVVPVTVTVYVLWQSFLWIDRLLRLEVPGAGFLVAVVFITLVGALASNYVGRRVFRLMDTLFARAPFVKMVYTAVRDLTEAFVGERKRFNRPVIVAFPEMGTRAYGFVTREVADGAGEVAVYLPQSYNIAGNLLLVPRENVQALDADPAQLMAFIVSGGVSGEVSVKGGERRLHSFADDRS